MAEAAAARQSSLPPCTTSARARTSSSSVCKCEVGLEPLGRERPQLTEPSSGDGQKLARDSKGALLCNGLLELNTLARNIDPVGCGPGAALISLANLSKAYLCRELDKGAVRRSDWSKRLTPAQKSCGCGCVSIDFPQLMRATCRSDAANDVYASFLIYKALIKLASENELDMDVARMAQNLGVEKLQLEQATKDRSQGATRGADGSDDNARVQYSASTHSSAMRAFVLFNGLGKELRDIAKEMRSADNPLALATVRSVPLRAAAARVRADRFAFLLYLGRGYILKIMIENPTLPVDKPQRVVDLIQDAKTKYDPRGTTALLQRMQQQAAECQRDPADPL